MSHNGYVQGLLENGFNVDIIMENTSFGETDRAMPVFKEAVYYEYNAVPFSHKLRDRIKKRVDAPATDRSEAPAAGSGPSQSSTAAAENRFRGILKKIYQVLFNRDHPYSLDKQWLKNAARFRSGVVYDLVVSNSSPASSHKLVSILKRKNRIKYKKWIQIWEDPWYYDLYAIHKKEAVLKEEQSLLEQADEIYYVSPLTLENQKRYFKGCAGKMSFVPLPYLVSDKDALAGGSSKEVSFGYFGDYYSHVRNLRPFYEALKRSGAKGYICGDTNERFESTGQITIHGRLTLDKLNLVQKETTVLISLCNLGGGQIPGKIYHYSATEKPVIFILDGTNEEKEKILKYFKPYNRFHFCNNDTEEILTLLTRFIAGEEALKENVLMDFSPFEVVKKIIGPHERCNVVLKKELLFINGHLNAGGGERSLTDLLKYMDFTKYNVDLLLFEGLGDYVQELPPEVNVIFYDITKTFGSYKACVSKAVKDKDGFTFALRHILLLQKLFGAKALRLARGLFKRLKKRYDCAVAYRPGFCTDFAANAVKADKKISWWHHGAFDMSQKAADRTMRAFNKMDYIASVSESCRRMLLEKFPGLDNKLVTIPNIVDTEAIAKKARLYQPEMRRGADCIRLVSVGRLSPEKNMAVCPDVCRILLRRGFQVEWYIIGGGVQEKELCDKIKEYGLSESVFLMGSLPNPYPYVRAADIYVHPSLVESQGISILEALSLSKPVVAAASLGPLEFIENKENGILTQPTAEDISGGVMSLLTQPSLRAHVAQRAEKTARLYAPEKILARLYDLIEQTCKEKDAY